MPKLEKKAPTAAILDSQSVGTTRRGGICGFDGGKRVKGRKRHILVDTLGMILLAKVHSAAVQDRDGARQVLQALVGCYGWLRKIWVDGAYRGALEHWVGSLLPRRGLHLDVVQKAAKGFQVLPKRWIVERTFAWLANFRRLSKDYEYRVDHSESMILLAMSRLMLRRLARNPNF